jgi:hypothetical protein
MVKKFVGDGGGERNPCPIIPLLSSSPEIKLLPNLLFKSRRRRRRR